MPTDKKISELTADPSISDDDLIPVVNDPAGTPTTNMITVSNLFASSSFSSGVLALNPVLKTATSTAGFSFVDTDGTMASNLSTKVPSQSAVVTYVAAHGGASGDIHSTDTQVKTGGVTWSWVNDTGTLATSTTTVPTEQTAKAYVDALPTLTTSDTAKVPVATVGGITTLDVTSLVSTSSGTYSDSVFTLQDNGDSTKQALFDCSGITTATTRTFGFPNNTGTSTLLTDLSVATVYNKTHRAPVLQISDSTGYGTTFGHYNDTATFTNDFSRTTQIEVFGSSSLAATIGFITQSGTSAIPAATAATQILGTLSFRGATGATAIATGGSARLTVLADELFTLTARGSHVSIFNTPATTITALEALRITSDTVPGVVLRGVLAVGAGSALASAATGYGVEVKSGAIGYGVGTGGTITQTNSRTTAVTLNTQCGAITLVSALGSTTFATFTVNNTAVAATDTVLLTQKSGTDRFHLFVTNIQANRFDITFAATVAATTEQPVFNFSVVKAVTS